MAVQFSGVVPGESIPGKSSVIGTLNVVALPGLSDADVTVLASVQGPSGGPSHVSGSVKVTAPDKASTVIQASLVDVPVDLNDGECTVALLQLANSTSTALTSILVSPVASGDIDVAVRQTTTTTSGARSHCADPTGEGAQEEEEHQSIAVSLDDLAPGEIRWIPVEFRAADSVRSGKQSVGVSVTATSLLQFDRAVPAETVVAMADIELRVFGVDALSPLGVSALFVVPGILAVVVFLFLRRTVYPRGLRAPDTVDLKDFRLMPYIVGAGVVAYILVWVLLGEDLTRAAGTRSILVLLLIGLLLGVAVWAIVAILYWAAFGRRLIRRDDDEVRLLRRLKARGSELELPAHTPKTGGLYLIVAPESESKSFGAPQIRYTVVGTGKEAAEAQKRFEGAIARSDIDELVRIVESKAIKLQWSDKNGIRVFSDADLTVGEAQLLRQSDRP